MSETVTWARPLGRAEKNLREAADLFERRKFVDGLMALHDAQSEIWSAASFILRAACGK